MKLAFKITLLLFAVIVLFITIISFYFYSQLNQDFERRSSELMAQSVSSIDNQMKTMNETLQSEMSRSSSSIFSENESVLAGLLATPPEFNSETIGFAEKLRRRTTLHFLYLISPDGIILSDSLIPARYGKKDLLADFPFDKIGFAFEDATCLELKQKATFGHRQIYLRGGFFLKKELQQIPSPQIQMQLTEINPTNPSGSTSAETPEATSMTRTIILKDYLSRPVAEVAVIASRKQLDEERSLLLRNGLLLIAGSLLFCLLTGFALSFSITKPVARLRDAAAEMASGNLDVRIADHTGGEVGELVSAFNHMAEQLQENQKRLLQTERIAAWQEIARHLAHEIKNPLMPIRTSLANLRVCMEKAPEKFAEIFPESSQSILEEVETLRHLADEFSRFARLPAPNLKPNNLNGVVQKCLTLYGADSSTEIRFEPGELPEFSFDSEQISEVIHNLVQNAVDAVEPNGMIKVSTETVREQNRQFVRLTVHDNGKGMDEETRRQVFKPYFTTKKKGTGLGLAIVHRIVTEHGGNIYVESGPGKGTQFEVLLPVS